jgi:uncharacterized Zn finger protein (UPF0148 family)
VTEAPSTDPLTVPCPKCGVDAVESNAMIFCGKCGRWYGRMTERPTE